MTAPFVIGVDPGGTTGIAVYDGLGDAELLQTTPGVVHEVVDALLSSIGPHRPRLVAIERFVADQALERINAGKIKGRSLKARFLD